MKLVLIIIGSLGLLFGILSYNQNRHLSDSKKKSIIIVGVSVIIILLAIFIRTDNVNSNLGKNNGRELETRDRLFELTNKEEKILRKKYEDLSKAEKKIFEKLEAKYDKLDSRYKDEYRDGIERLREERARSKD